MHVRGKALHWWWWAAGADSDSCSLLADLVSALRDSLLAAECEAMLTQRVQELHIGAIMLSRWCPLIVQAVPMPAQL